MSSNSNDTQLDRRDFIRTLAVVGVAAGTLTLESATAEAASCPKFPKPKVSKEMLRIESEVGDVVDGQMDLRTVVRTPDGGHPTTMSCELFFDNFESGSSVRPVTDTVANLALVNPALHRPPTALLTWGTGLAFKCVVESSRTGFTMFLDDGTPVRAIMNVRLALLEDCTLGGTP